MGQERVAWAKMAAVLVTARLCEPSSELHIAEDWYRRAALCDLLQLGDEEVNKDRLYRGPDRLLAHKAALEAHLSARCGELFAVENDVLLYDVTSTYFEGQAGANPHVAGHFGLRFWIARFQWLGVVPETSAWTFNLRFPLPLDI